MRFTLVESDARKSTFLRTVARETAVAVDIVSERIETIEPLNADVISARALANLGTLLRYGRTHLHQDGTALFPKGETWREELEEAQNKWQFFVQPVPSLTDPRAVILKIRGIDRG